MLDTCSHDPLIVFHASTEREDICNFVQHSPRVEKTRTESGRVESSRVDNTIVPEDRSPYRLIALPFLIFSSRIADGPFSRATCTFAITFNTTRLALAFKQNMTGGVTLVSAGMEHIWRRPFFNESPNIRFIILVSTFLCRPWAGHFIGQVIFAS